MSKKTKYKQLCEAYQKGVEECDQYRKACREFVVDLRGTLLETFQCPETKIFMFPPTHGFVFKSSRIQGDAYDTEFADNGVALIGFAINANLDSHDDKFFTFIVTFKKTQEKITCQILDDDKEFSNADDGLVDFCEHIFKLAHKNLSERLKVFLQSPDEESAPIGFRVQNESGTQPVSKKP